MINRLNININLTEIFLLNKAILIIANLFIRILSQLRAEIK